MKDIITIEWINSDTIRVEVESQGIWFIPTYRCVILLCLDTNVIEISVWRNGKMAEPIAFFPLNRPK
jgi:hypothetical protein